MTLDEIRAQVRARCHIDGNPSITTATLDAAIALGQTRVEKELDGVASEVVWSGVPGTDSLPANLGRIRSVTRSADDGGFVELKPLTALEAQKWSFQPDGDSLGYIISGDELAVYPGSEATHVIRYWPRLTLPTQATGTNWAMSDFPELVIYASCIEVGDLLLSQSLSDLYQARYLEAVGKTQADQERQRYGPGLATQSLYDSHARIARGM